MLHFLWQRPAQFAGTIAVRIINAALLVGYSFIFQIIIDVSTGRLKWSFPLLIVGIFIYMLVLDGIYTTDTYASVQLLNTTSAKVRSVLVQRMSLLHPDEFNQVGVGSLVGKLTKQLDNVANTYYKEIVDLVFAAAQLIFATIGTMLISPFVTLIAFVLCIPSLFVPYFTRNMLARASEAKVAQIDAYTSKITDLLSGFHTFKSALAEKAMLHQHESANQQLLGAERYNQKINTLAAGISYLLNDLMYITTWLIGALMLQRGQMNVGQLVAFGSLIGQLSWPMVSLTQSLPHIMSGRKAAEALNDFINRPVPASHPVQHLNLDQTDPHLFALENASYTADTQQILTPLDLTIAADQKILIVGASGGGKSTLVRLLLGEISPSTGTSTFIGQPASELARSDVYRNIGLLSQKNYIFRANVRDNMTLFGQADDAAIITALERAGLGGWLSQHDLDTELSDDGPELSGGEKQRFALARLYLRGSRYFIFDELTTGLDPHIADQLLQDLFSMTQGFLMITHTYNAAAFAKADEVLVIRSGRIAARGKAAAPQVATALHALALE